MDLGSRGDNRPSPLRLRHSEAVPPQVTVLPVNGTADYPIYEWVLTRPSLLRGVGKAIDKAFSYISNVNYTAVSSPADPAR